MQNDVLKNKIAPWQEKGRWYHAHITEAGLDTDNTDKFFIDNFSVTTASKQVTCSDPSISIVDYFIVINSVTSDGSQRTFYKQIGVRSNNAQLFVIPQPNQYNKIDFDVYIFILNI